MGSIRTVCGVLTVVFAANFGFGASDKDVELGKAKFAMLCGACHRSGFDEEMVAPPTFALKRHYGDRYGNNERAFVRAIVNWVQSPDQKKTLMPGAVRKFSLMPPLPFPEEDLTLIAKYLFETDFDIPEEACATE